VLAALEAWRQAGWEPVGKSASGAGHDGRRHVAGRSLLTAGGATTVTASPAGNAAIYYQASSSGANGSRTALGFSGPITIISKRLRLRRQCHRPRLGFDSSGRAERVVAGGYDAGWAKWFFPASIPCRRFHRQFAARLMRAATAWRSAKAAAVVTLEKRLKARGDAALRFLASLWIWHGDLTCIISPSRINRRGNTTLTVMKQACASAGCHAGGN